MKKVLIAIIALFSVAVANAATVTYGDYGVVNVGEDYIPGEDTLVFDCGLSLANQICTLGANLDPGEVIFYQVTAPAEFDLKAKVTTGPDFTGSNVLSPNFYSRVYAGTSFIFALDGNYAQGLTKYLSVGIVGNTVALDFLGANGEYGLLPPPTGAVPVPAAFWLFGSGLLGLVAVARRKNKTTSQ